MNIKGTIIEDFKNMEVKKRRRDLSIYFIYGGKREQNQKEDNYENLPDKLHRDVIKVRDIKLEIST